MQLLHCVIAILEIGRDLVELRLGDLVQSAHVRFLCLHFAPVFGDFCCRLLIITFLKIPLLFELLELVKGEAFISALSCDQKIQELLSILRFVISLTQAFVEYLLGHNCVSLYFRWNIEHLADFELISVQELHEVHHD